MKISLQWINELVTIELVELDNLIDNLTLGGFEVEEILETKVNNQKQIILDISATANRSDSLSIQGISTEIKALLNKPSKISDYSIEIENWKENIQNFAGIVCSKEDCSIFMAVIVENVKNLTVPKWIKEKLLSSGITPLNNLLDFQNYILLETGYPFAFYDFKKISERLQNSKFTFSLSKAENNQEFVGANKITYNLNDSILVVKVNEIILSIAGIIENYDLSYSENTNSLLIEGSIFNASKIRQQSRNLGLRTERSARYEKSLRNTYLVESFYRLISLLKIFNPNLTCKLHTITKSKEEILQPILLRYQTINEILGPIEESVKNTSQYISPEIIESYLNRLNLKFLYNKPQLTWEVKIPHSRTEDLIREIDLIEEIGRLHGFDNFLIRLPKINRIGTEDSTYKARKKITSCLLNLGLTELIHYSLVNQKTFQDNQVKLLNPLVGDYSYLRLSLLPNLIKTVEENLKQGNQFIEGFEYGHVFYENSKNSFHEKEHVAGIFGGLKTKLTWSDSEQKLTWFEAKGKIEQFFKQLNLVPEWKKYSKKNDINIFHPYRSANLYLHTNIELGVFGQIHPILSNHFNISSEIYLFEFDIQSIENQIATNKITLYNDYSFYPKIMKDLSFIIEKNISYKELRETLYLNGTEFLCDINLLDEYTGQSIPEQHVSLCLQLVFQSGQKTLQNKEIENIIKNLQLILTNKFKATIRN